jgi:hypothetical protein
MSHHFDVQGRFLGLPYDWRWPSLHKVLSRVWNPGGPMLSPKSFGWGFTLNLANGRTWLLFVCVLLVALLVCWR